MDDDLQEEKSSARSSFSQMKSSASYALSYLNKFNCVEAIRRGNVPDWYGHLRHSLETHMELSQYSWSAQLAKEVSKL